ncbi:helix-turn-helix transcriptional regulator [Psychrobacter immobilis]|uniref:helix-turn-helix transcriptional regulator n=1 Tax=Psychrobacter immobilis TaxID=498 RepID=UPI003FD5D4E7
MTNLRRLRIDQVANKVALPRSTIYEKIKAGTFPSQYKDGSSSFWFEHELDAWLIKVHDLHLEPVTENEEETA